MSALIKINWDDVAYLLEAGASGVDIAGSLGIHENTLYNRCKDDLGVDFVAFKAKNRAKGDNELLKAQYEKAVKEKDNTMLIFLGKARLNQSDKQQIELSGNPEAPVTFQLDERFTKKD
jgi:hypothetical protein